MPFSFAESREEIIALHRELCKQADAAYDRGDQKVCIEVVNSLFKMYDLTGMAEEVPNAKQMEIGQLAPFCIG